MSGKLRKKGCHPILLRVIEYTIENRDNPTEQIRYRLITSLLDIEKFPAQLLAIEYHQPWEVENTIDELKVHLLARKTPVRSQKPREAVQEIYGWLLAHWAVRSLIFQAANSNPSCTITPEFHWDITSYSSCVAKIPTLATSRTPFFFSWLNLEILDTLLPERVHRTNPRVVKKPVSKFRSKRVKHRGTGTRTHPPIFLILSTV
ncbi:IS4 transposase [Nostoc flagelliforme CCNUN1]|uniref:IS4 transposase n=1 Tax=Nostoc flagelliforme CCNUN1 TaxID=2038116 RepID=A0A2K8SRY1_9NOSO|nr:IS4 transposase [Nostoc flagelliforme CCNUN1]